MDEKFQSNRNAQDTGYESYAVYPENKQEQSTGVVSFMSVFEDFEFSQTWRGAPGTFSCSSEESDPFHCDWPYWDNN